MGYNSELSIRNRKKAAVVLAIIAGLLCFIGLFGIIMKEYSVEGAAVQLRETFDLVYIFKRGWYSQYYEGNNVSKFALTLMTISFSIGALGCLFAAGKTIRSLIIKEEVNFKFNLSILLVSAAQYVFMSRFALGYDAYKEVGTNYSTNTTYLMGWGVILITIGFFLGLLAIFLNDFEDKGSVLNKSSILTRIACIAIFFVGLYGLTNMVSISFKSNILNYTSTKSYNVFSFISSFLNGDVGPSSSKYAGTMTLAIIAAIFGVISFIGVVASAFFYIKGVENEKEKRIEAISTISFVAASLISNIFMIIAGHVVVKDTTIPYITISIVPGFTFIVSLILGIAIILLVYFRDRVFKKTK